MASMSIPDKIGRYRVIRELGRGGMGMVYLGEDPFIGRQVAIKTSLTPPPLDPVEFEAFQQKFFNEARTAGKMSHPNIVSLYDATMETLEDDRFYLIMEYVDGITLKDYRRKEAQPPVDMVVKIMFKCAKALDYANQQGVIHRDIKPSNIMISKEGEVKVSDFGIAAVEEAGDMESKSSATGSVSYSSPEQLRGDPLTSQTDIFSLGVVMYELLAGVHPFMADTAVATFFKINNEDPKPIKAFRPDVPDSLQQIVMRALVKDPAKRYQSALQLASELSASFDLLRFVQQEITFEEKLEALKKVGFFRDFSFSEMAEVIRTIQWVKHRTGSTIITEGEIEESFYIIVTGKVVVKKGKKSLASLKQGDCFGEMSYFGKTKRTATIIAAEDTIMMKLNASLIDQTSLKTQLRFYREFTHTLIQRLTQTSKLLSKVG